MTADARSLVQRLYEEFWNAGRDEVADEIISPDFVDHHVPPEIPSGPEGVRQWAAIAKGGFPDFHIEILDVVEGGDKVACRIEFSGTHTGDFNGIAPTGNRTAAQAISLFRAEAGMLVEGWEFADVPAFLEPLGIVLSPAGD
jgi:predicted ester cyclase